MKLKRQMAILTLFLMFSCLFFGSTAFVSAKDMDGVGQQSQQSGGEDYGNSVSDYLQNREVIGDEEMQKANNLASPMVSVIGTIAGFIVLIASAAIFAITALDLLYIGVPFTRTYLAPAQVSGGGAMGGMNGGMMGGMGAMGGGQQQPKSTKSVILGYFKKRVFFIVIFSVCTIVLTSSIVTDCGINLGKLFLKATAALNGNLSEYAAS